MMIDLNLIKIGGSDVQIWWASECGIKEKSEEDLYWSGLYKVYNKFNKDFSEFLGVNNEIIKDSSNERIPVLTIGVYDEEKQCVDDAFDSQLPKDNNFYASTAAWE